ncbi:MAG: DUF624 domain-containing protein [Acetatifactor sp.]|nr:DUF624 domain-containing protein [Acetatifactor sp.]
MKFLDIDSPFMQVMGKVADLMILNLITLICLIPFVTAGAALTAMHYQVLKIVRNEECYVVKGYFKAFRENFVQSTVIWLIMLLIALILGGDFYIMYRSGAEFHVIFKAVMGAISIFAVFTLLYVFPIQAKFANTVFRTIKNALAMSILLAPKSVLMLVLYLLPIALAGFFPSIFPLIVLFGMTLPAFLAAKMYNKFFLKLEDRINEANGTRTEQEDEADDGKIFHDQLDTTLEDKI